LLRFHHLGLIPRLSCYEIRESGWEHFLASLLDHAEHEKADRSGDPPLSRRPSLTAPFPGEQYRDGLGPRAVDIEPGRRPVVPVWPATTSAVDATQPSRVGLLLDA
jgi:hypothetical protein